MCGRLNNHIERLNDWNDMLVEWPDVQQSYNLAPTQQLSAFITTQGQSMRWGLIPSWAKEFDSKYATFNARIESVESKPAFRSAWGNKQRCLIPMAGYYEWAGAKENKQPFYITDRDTQGLVVAGLYEQWSEESGKEHLSCTMLTTQANDELGNIHSRMPIMLTPQTANKWLSGEDKHQLLSGELPNIIYYPVGKEVGNTRNDHIGLIESV